MIQYDQKSHSYVYVTAEYPAVWRSAVDGDTAHLMFDRGTRDYGRESFRIRGINAPELHDKDPAKRQRAQQAAATLAAEISLLSGEWPLRIVVQKSKTFDRWVADVFYRRPSAPAVEVSLADVLLAAGVVDLDPGPF